MESAVNFFHLGMSVSAYGSIRACLDEGSAKSGPACRFDQFELCSSIGGSSAE